MNSKHEALIALPRQLNRRFAEALVHSSSGDENNRPGIPSPMGGGYPGLGRTKPPMMILSGSKGAKPPPTPMNGNV